MNSRDYKTFLASIHVIAGPKIFFSNEELLDTGKKQVAFYGFNALSAHIADAVDRKEELAHYYSKNI